MPSSPNLTQPHSDPESSTNRTKILGATQLSMNVADFFDRWERRNIDTAELRLRTGMWFMDNQRRRIFFNIIDWAERFKDGYPDDEGIVLKISVLESQEFRRWWRRELYDDFAERFRTNPEWVTILYWLLGGDQYRPKPEGENAKLTDVLGL